MIFPCRLRLIRQPYLQEADTIVRAVLRGGQRLRKINKCGPGRAGSACCGVSRLRRPLCLRGQHQMKAPSRTVHHTGDAHTRLPTQRVVAYSGPH